MAGIFIIGFYFFLLIVAFSFSSNNSRKDYFMREDERLRKKLKYLTENAPVIDIKPADIIKNSQPYIDDIKIAFSVSEGDLREQLESILNSIEKVKLGVFENSNSFPNVRRLFEYYIPQTIKTINIRGIARNSNDNERLIQADKILGKLVDIYSEYAKAIYFQDSKSIEIDVNLLEKSLSEDLIFFDTISKKQHD